MSTFTLSEAQVQAIQADVKARLDKVREELLSEQPSEQDGQRQNLPAGQRIVLTVARLQSRQELQKALRLAASFWRPGNGNLTICLRVPVRPTGSDKPVQQAPKGFQPLLRPLLAGLLAFGVAFHLFRNFRTA